MKVCLRSVIKELRETDYSSEGTANNIDCSGEWSTLYLTLPNRTTAAVRERTGQPALLSEQD